QLIPTPDGKARRVAMEILLGTPLVQDYIRDGEIHKLKDVMKESTNLGMKTFDQSLFELYQAGEISYEDALRYADSANEVRLRIKLAQGGDARTLSQALDGVEVAEADCDAATRGFRDGGPRGALSLAHYLPSSGDNGGPIHPLHGDPYGLHPAQASLRLRRARAAYRRADDGNPPHQAPPDLHQQRQRRARRHGVGGQER